MLSFIPVFRSCTLGTMETGKDLDYLFCLLLSAHRQATDDSSSRTFLGQDDYSSLGKSKDSGSRLVTTFLILHS